MAETLQWLSLVTNCKVKVTDDSHVGFIERYNSWSLIVKHNFRCKCTLDVLLHKLMYNKIAKDLSFVWFDFLEQFMI